MSAFDLLQGWLRPLLEPLNEVQSVTQQPLTLHQESVSEFSSLVEGLYQGPNAFEGDAANAVKGMTESYLQLEANFSGAGTLATSTTAVGNVLTMPTTATSDIVLTDVAATSLECGSEITAAAATAAGEIGADAGLDAVTSAIDVAAVAQAGLDPVTDIPAAIVTAIDMATKIAILVALGWSIFNAVLRWINEMNRLGHVTWPPLPSFLDPGGGVLNALTPQQDKNANDAIQRLTSMGVYYTSSDVENLAKQGLTPEQIVEALQVKNQLTQKHVRFSLYRLAVLVKMGYSTNDIVTIVSKVNESSTQFRGIDERWIGNWLVLTGRAEGVTPIAASQVIRDGDAVVDLYVDGKIQRVRVEFKSLRATSSQRTLEQRLQDSLEGGGQANHMVFDIHKTRITKEQAQQFLDKVKSQGIDKSLLSYILIIGDGFVLEAQY